MPISKKRRRKSGAINRTKKRPVNLSKQSEDLEKNYKEIQNIAKEISEVAIEIKKELKPITKRKGH